MRHLWAIVLFLALVTACRGVAIPPATTPQAKLAATAGKDDAVSGS